MCAKLHTALKMRRFWCTKNAIFDYFEWSALITVIALLGSKIRADLDPNTLNGWFPNTHNPTRAESYTHRLWRKKHKNMKLCRFRHTNTEILVEVTQRLPENPTHTHFTLFWRNLEIYLILGIKLFFHRNLNFVSIITGSTSSSNNDRTKRYQ